MAEGGLNCIKYLLFGFNLMFFLCGAGILGVGIWLRVEKGDYVSFTDYEFATASSLAIAAGAVIVIVTFFGVVGSIKENRVLLLMFFVSLLLIFCLEISAGGLAYANRGKIETEVKKDLNVTIHEKYGKEEGTTKAIDKMQEYFKCCGNAMYQDWRYSQYYLDNKYKYPPSCCMKSKRTDTCGGDTKNLNQRGCYEEVKKFLLKHLLIIGIVGIVFGLIQVRCHAMLVIVQGTLWLGRTQGDFPVDPSDRFYAPKLSELPGPKFGIATPLDNILNEKAPIVSFYRHILWHMN